MSLIKLMELDELILMDIIFSKCDPNSGIFENAYVQSIKE
jgi:hypothetical protein